MGENSDKKTDPLPVLSDIGVILEEECDEDIAEERLQILIDAKNDMIALLSLDWDDINTFIDDQGLRGKQTPETKREAKLLARLAAANKGAKITLKDLAKELMDDDLEVISRIPYLALKKYLKEKGCLPQSRKDAFQEHPETDDPKLTTLLGEKIDGSRLSYIINDHFGHGGQETIARRKTFSELDFLNRTIEEDDAKCTECGEKPEYGLGAGRHSIKNQHLLNMYRYRNIFGLYRRAQGPISIYLKEKGLI